MNKSAIRVEELSKRYRIGQFTPHLAMHQLLESLLRKPFRRSGWSLSKPEFDLGEVIQDHYLWALRNISFQVVQREIVGILGKNGAGKSVLLKVLSRVTKPTEGYAEIYGRIGAMLEVGTGFHPELSGRENIYLNGAILGMKKTEIDRKFDAIVAFSEAEEFLDTPVKRYSSGMRVRLAFAVAAQLEPEILLIDEVLAVSDEAFRQKCLNRIKEMASEGRTVLFVSHNLKAIETLCHRAILLSKGQIVMDGKPGEVVSCYQAQSSKSIAI